MKNFIFKNKPYIIIVCFLIFLILINLETKEETETEVDSMIISIHYSAQNKSNLTILTRNESGPTYYSFTKKIDLDEKNIELTDIVTIKTDGLIMSSYPGQASGFDIELKTKTQKTKVNHESYHLKGSSYDENSIEEFDYRRFKTKVFSNKEDYLNFAKQKAIVLPDIDLDELFLNKIIIIAYSYMSAMPKIELFDVFNTQDNLFVQINIQSPPNEEYDMVLRGFIITLDKEHLNNKEYETVTKNITL